MAPEWSALWLGLRAAALSTALAVAVGPWLAFVSRRHAAAPLAWLPLSVAPALLCGYCLMASPFRWAVAALVALVFTVPYLMRAAAAAYAGLHPGYLNAARGLGAPEWRIFWRVAGPLALRPILGAAAYAFAVVATECGAMPIVARAVRMPGPLATAPLVAIAAIGLAVYYLGTRLDRGPDGQ